MSRLEPVRGRGNVYDPRVHPPIEVVDRGLTTIDVPAPPRGGADTPDEPGDLLVRATRVPPGGVVPLDGRLVRVVLSPQDMQTPPTGADGSTHSLECHPGSLNVYVLDFGLPEGVPALPGRREETLAPTEADEPRVG